MLEHGRRALVWLNITRELAIVVACYALYSAGRGATQSEYSVALQNARAIMELERGIGILWEVRLQDLIIDHHQLIAVSNWIYLWGHMPVIITVGLWLLLRQPSAYRLYRNAFLISGAVGLAIFVLYPVAPPRLTDMPIVDTVAAYSDSYQVLQPPAFVNQYAAVPSLHFGWNLLIGIALVRHVPVRHLRALGFAAPVLMGSAIVVTGNHFIIDAVFGAVVALFGLLVAIRLERSLGRPGQPLPAPAHRLRS